MTSHMLDHELKGFECEELNLDDDYEGPCRAFLVSRIINDSKKAVLYVHGWNDYFFQSHVAEFFNGIGYSFYAIDLRKHGRALMQHQTPNFCKDLTEYFEEIDLALHKVRWRDGNNHVILNAHSTGGLLATLYCQEHNRGGGVDGLVLNSPFFGLNESSYKIAIIKPIVNFLGTFFPFKTAPSPEDVYGPSIHRDYFGDWDFNRKMKPIPNFPVKFGWLRSVMKAQDKIRFDGGDVGIPTLVCYSTRSERLTRFDERAKRMEIVIDIRDVKLNSKKIGSNVTEAAIEDGIHDLSLSGIPARDSYFHAIEHWLSTIWSPES